VLVFRNDLGPPLSSFIRARFERVSTMEKRHRHLSEGGDVREQSFHGSPHGDETFTAARIVVHPERCGY
jgi:hypothetical protein